MKRKKKKYICPELSVTILRLNNAILTTSVEDFNDHIGSEGDWGDPIIDPDDDIIW